MADPLVPQPRLELIANYSYPTLLGTSDIPRLTGYFSLLRMTYPLVPQPRLELVEVVEIGNEEVLRREPVLLLGRGVTHVTVMSTM